MNKEGFILYISHKDTFDVLTDEEAGKLIKCIFEYEKSGQMSDVDRTLKLAFIPIKQTLDNNREKYAEKCKKNKENAKKRWNNTNVCERKISDTNYTNKDKDKDKDNDNDKDINNNNSISDGCVDGLEKVFDFYKSNIGDITPYIEKMLKSFSNNLNTDVLLYALEISVEANQKNIRYIKAILNNWTKANIKTLEEAKNESKNKKITKKLTEREYGDDEFKGMYVN